MGVVGLLEVEVTFLACVSDAMWQHADMKMRKLVQRARSTHALFYVHLLHGVELVFCGTG